MQKQTLKSQIQKKEKQIQLLRLIFRAVKKFQEKKDRGSEKTKINDLENNLKNF